MLFNALYLQNQLVSVVFSLRRIGSHIYILCPLWEAIKGQGVGSNRVGNKLNNIKVSQSLP